MYIIITRSASRSRRGSMIVEVQTERRGSLGVLIDARKREEAAKTEDEDVESPVERLERIKSATRSRPGSSSVLAVPPAESGTRRGSILENHSKMLDERRKQEEETEKDAGKEGSTQIRRPPSQPTSRKSSGVFGFMKGPLCGAENTIEAN